MSNSLSTSTNVPDETSFSSSSFVSSSSSPNATPTLRPAEFTSDQRETSASDDGYQHRQLRSGTVRPEQAVWERRRYERRGDGEDRAEGNPSSDAGNPSQGSGEAGLEGPASEGGGLMAEEQGPVAEGVTLTVDGLRQRLDRVSEDRTQMQDDMGRIETEMRRMGFLQERANNVMYELLKLQCLC